MITVALPLPPREVLERRYAEMVDSYDKLLYELQRRIKAVLSAREINATIKHRVKSFKSYYQKLLRIARDNDANTGSISVTDIIALRVVCPFLDEVSAAEAALQQEYEVHEVDRKGAEFSVREFGYESTHCLLRVPQDLCESFHIGGPFECEVQLRTILQDAWAEVEHEIVYKSEYTPLDESVQRKLAALNANLSLSDITFQEIRNYQRALIQELTHRRVEFWRSLSQTVGTQALAANGNGAALDSKFEFEPADLGVSQDLHHPRAPEPRASGGSSADTGGAPSAESTAGESGTATGEDTVRASEGAKIGNLDSELLTALKAHNAGDHARARQIYTRILDSGPQKFVRTVLLMHRGMAEFSDGAHREALADFSAALELDPTNSRAHFYRGTVCRALGDYQQAEIDFGKSLALDPYRVECLYQRSALRLQTGDLDGASADCNAALSIEPDSGMLKRIAAAIEQRRAHGGPDE